MVNINKNLKIVYTISEEKSQERIIVYPAMKKIGKGSMAE